MDGQSVRRNRRLRRADIKYRKAVCLGGNDLGNHCLIPVFPASFRSNSVACCIERDVKVRNNSSTFSQDLLTARENNRNSHHLFLFFRLAVTHPLATNPHNTLTSHQTYLQQSSSSSAHPFLSASRSRCSPPDRAHSRSKSRDPSS